MFLRGCSDHQDQLFCLLELKNLPGLTNRVQSRSEKIFSMEVNCMSLAEETEKTTTEVFMYLLGSACTQPSLNMRVLAAYLSYPAILF